MGKMRLTIPKKEEDMEKIVQEVMESHPEMAEEHEHSHNHEHEEGDIVDALNAIADAINHLAIHIENVEKRLDSIERELNNLKKQRLNP
ncbi:MAG: hypothetical protein GU347_04040 [Desulfurococcales archaeon]|uniref:Uncharacterized protein n=1 Tax=Fervidicoccus fontis TaxID=683846 RepID=A0A7J3SJ49_9CREN|nr:hypothetical protein [Thermoprotei archaeon]NAY89867.1 hypothetical protein [Desulfurococcales archaeon]